MSGNGPFAMPPASPSEPAERVVSLAQPSLPPAAEFRQAFEGIFDRRFFANHGPLEHQLDAELAAYFGVRNAVSVVNGTTALMLVVRALSLRGDVIVPGFASPAIVQALAWAGLSPVYCDIDPRTHTLTARLAATKIGHSTAAILGVHMWGRACDPIELGNLARERGLKLIFDAADAAGCRFEGRRVGGFGDAEVFSFRAGTLLSGAEGGCVTTDDDALASRLRTMRSFHDGPGLRDADQGAKLLRLNAKISEAQAAMVLLSLRHAAALIGENRLRYELYRRELAGVPGLTFVDHADGGESNFQSVVVSIMPAGLGISRDALLAVLHAERIMAGGGDLSDPLANPPSPRRADADLPVADRLRATLVRLPTGQAVTTDEIGRACAVIRAASADPGAAARPADR